MGLDHGFKVRGADDWFCSLRKQYPLHGAMRTALGSTPKEDGDGADEYALTPQIIGVALIFLMQTDLDAYYDYESLLEDIQVRLLAGESINYAVSE